MPERPIFVGGKKGGLTSGCGCWLVVWNMFFFSYIGNVIIPTDELIFFRGVGLNHQAGMVSEPCFSLIFSEPHEF